MIFQIAQLGPGGFGAGQPGNIYNAFDNAIEQKLQMTRRAQQLLICFEYDQTAADGPPFSVPAAEVERRYAAAYEIVSLARLDVEGGLKGVCPALETVWRLRSRD